MMGNCFSVRARQRARDAVLLIVICFRHILYIGSFFVFVFSRVKHNILGGVVHSCNAGEGKHFIAERAEQERERDVVARENRSLRVYLTLMA